MWQAGLTFLACWLALAWPWLSGRVTIPYDAKAQFLPQVQFLAHSMWQNESPFWTPFVFSGHPQIADPQSLIFSPFLLLALLDPTPGIWAADLTTFLTIAAGGLGLLIWTRDQGWHAGAGLLTALTFAFGAAMSWRVQHIGQVVSLSLLAITLMLLSRALSRGSWRYGLSAGLAAAFMVLQRDQVALLGVYLLSGLVIWHLLSGTGSWRSRAVRTLGPLIPGGIAGLAIIALPVLLTLLFAEMSNRPQIDLVGAGKGSLHPALLLTLLVPDLFGASGEMGNYWGPPSFAWPDTGLYIAQNMGVLYVGAAPVWLILGGLISRRLWHPEIRFYTVAALLMIIYTLGWYTPAFGLAHAWLPGIDLFRRPADAVFLIGFLASILAGYSLDRLLSDREPPLPGSAWVLSGLIILSGFGVAGYLATLFGRWHMALAPFLASLAICAAAGLILSQSRRLTPFHPYLASALIVIFTVADLGVQNGPNGATGMPASDYDVLDTSHHDETMTLLQELVRKARTDTRRERIELVKLGFHWPNASLTYGLENTVGYNPLRLELYEQATGAGDFSDKRTFSPLMRSYASPLADLLGLRFIASGVPIEKVDPGLEPGALRLVARTGDAYVYENPDTWPRVMFATQAQRADFKQLLSHGGLPDIDFGRTVFLESTQHHVLPESATGSARILTYRNDEIVIETSSSDGGWLVLNDVWHPWWFADLDGEAAPTLRANVLFRAVALPRGRHTVRFRFQPVRGALDQLRRAYHGSVLRNAND